MSNTEIVTRTPQQELVAQIRGEQFSQQVALALPEGIPAHRFVRATVTALMQNPDLVKAETDSLFTSLIRCAQIGLMPDGREAAIVMFGSKATAMPMVGGYRKIAAEHGWSIRASVVFANDEFDHVQGMTETVRHLPVRPGQARGDRVAVYAVGTHRDGRKEVAVLYADDVEKVRRSSRSKDSGPWRDWTERMWEKTAARRLFQILPLDHADRRVANALNAEELEPVEAAGMLYGPSAPASAALPPAREPIEGEITNGVHTGTPREPGDTTTEAGGGQQGAAAPESADEAAAAPDPADDPEPQLELPAEPAAKAPTIAQARKVVLTWGVNKGKTLGEAAGADGAVTYMSWAIRNLGRFEPDAAAALLVVCKHDVPDAYAVFEEREAKAARS